MSFVTWLALPVGITLVASLIMVLFSHRPRTNTHQDIENFARFRGALARPMAVVPPPGSVPLSSSTPGAPPDAVGAAAAPPAGPAAGRGSGGSGGSAGPAGANLGSAAGPTAAGSNATVLEDRRRPARTGVAASPDR